VKLLTKMMDGKHMRTVGALLSITLGACTVADGVVPVRWEFSLRCKADAARTEYVELKVAKGDCPVTGGVVFQTVSSNWDAPGSRQQGLPAGRYAFHATAVDESGQEIASRCETVQLPREQRIAVQMQAASTCGEGAEPDAGDGEQGQDSGASPDAGPLPDAGSLPDSGSLPDAGPACPDPTDSDSDGVADCMDECPNDGEKAMPGQCGCGMPEADQDKDGTSDCIDKCPMNENKTEPGMCGCAPKTGLTSGQKLLVGEFLCGPRDDSVRLILEADGYLRLRVNGLEVWSTQPESKLDQGIGGQVKMQEDGNLVVRANDVSASIWSSKTQYATYYVTSLAVNADGTVSLSRPGEPNFWKRPL